MKVLKNILLNSLFRKNKDITKSNFEKNKTDHWVTFTLNNKTSFLQKGWSYRVVKEDETFYWFKFDNQYVKYPKFYFEEYDLFI